jgi:enoyl-CoA hydratase/carnithine racemase
VTTTRSVAPPSEANANPVLIERIGDVTLLKMNRPEKLNAWSAPVSNALNEFFQALNSGEYSTRAIVLTGEGRAFCAGGDVSSFPGSGAVGGGQARRRLWRRPHLETYTVQIMRNCDVPIIGAINGYAVGLGFGVALGTDLRVAADDAVFAVSQTTRGLLADYGLGHFLNEALGPQRAMELMLTGRRVSAQEALDLGLVLKVVPRDQLVEEAVDLATQIAKGPPLGMAASKRVIYMNQEANLSRVVDFTALTIDSLFVSDDGIEGVRSFVERRDPVFKGS